MSYIDRIREMTYTSPSGNEFTLRYRDVERTGGHKAAITELPQSDIPDVQDLGAIGERLPITCWLGGADYDIEADRLWQALKERGPGSLVHPRWGTHRVLPVTVGQKESLVEGMMRATFTLDFAVVGEAEYPQTSRETSAAIEAQADAAADEAVASGEIIEAETPSDLARIKDRITKAVARANERMQRMTAANAAMTQSINAQATAITRGIDTLVQTPIDLANSYVTLLRAPARAEQSVKSKVTGYASLISASVDALIDETVVSAGEAAFAVLDLLGLSLGCAESVSVGTVSSRAEALAVHDALAAAMDAAQLGVESVEGSVAGYFSPAGLMALIAEMRSSAASLLINQSYALPVERSLVLSGDRTPLDLIAELYPDRTDIDDALDEFIEENVLTGSLICVIPRGTEVRYYER